MSRPKLVQPLPEGEITAAQAFDQIFWPAYPRKICRFAAMRAWTRLKLRDDDQETLDAIMRGLEHWKEHEWRDKEPKFICHASTWLNQRRWEGVE